MPNPKRPHSSEGFTLIELLIVITIIPLIIGALSLGLITILSLQSGISTRTGDASDAQVVSSTFLKDVQSAAMITEAQPTSIPLACGSGTPYSSTPTQLLGLEWGNNGGNFRKVKARSHWLAKTVEPRVVGSAGQELFSEVA